MERGRGHAGMRLGLYFQLYCRIISSTLSVRLYLQLFTVSSTEDCKTK